MKRFFLALLAVVVMANLSVADDGVMPKTKMGDKALLFTINGFGNFGIGNSPVGTVPSYTTAGVLQSTNLSGFGMKYYLADNLALRGSLAFGLQSSTTKSAAGDNKSSQMMFGLLPGVQYHISRLGPVTAYVGGWAVIGIWSGSSTPAGGAESKASGTVFGAGGMLGAEFYPWDNISLGAEYQLGLTASSSKVEPAGAASQDGPSITNVGINAFAVTLGVNW